MLKRCKHVHIMSSSLFKIDQIHFLLRISVML
jgi:hypothetical protein